MKWSPSRDEPDKWRLERDHETRSYYAPEHLASVEKGGRAPLYGLGSVYSAEVVVPGAVGKRGYGPAFRTAPVIFDSLKAAQQWCEQEVKLMEVGELA